MNIVKSVALMGALTLSAHFAHAQVATPQAAGYVGLLAGYADTTNMDGTFGYGINVGLTFPNGWNGSIWALNSVADESGADVTLLQYGLGVDYSLKGLVGDSLGFLRGGLKAGMSTIDVDVPGADSDSDFVFGPSVSSDWMLTESFSLGGEADLLFVMGDEGYSTLYLFASGKYWF